MSTLPPPAQPPGASPSDVVAALAGNQSPAAGVTQGSPPAALVQGVVQSVQWGTGGTQDTLTATISGNATPVAGIAFMGGYTPVAGDTVWIIVAGSSDSAGSDHLVLGVQSGAGGSAGTGIPVGAELMTPGTINDPAWLLENGSSFSGATYPKLQAFLGGTTLPDMRGYSPMGAGATVGLNSTAGALTVTLTTAQMPAHAHTQGTHGHTGSASQSTHNHGNAGQYFVQSGSGDKGGAGILTGGNGYALGSVTTSSSAGGISVSVAAASAGAISSVGSGNPVNVLSPVRGKNFYIRAL